MLEQEIDVRAAVKDCIMFMAILMIACAADGIVDILFALM